MHARSRRPVVLALAALLVSLAGCASPKPAAPSALRLTMGADFPSLNPLVSTNWNMNIASELWHGFLLRTDDRGRLVPDLATVVPTIANGGIAPDGRTIVYHLRTNARWHDGAPFEARDVVFSFAAVRNPRNDVPDRSGYDDVASVTARGAHDVVVRLKKRYSPAVATFFATGANAPYPILPAHLLAGLPELNDAPYNGAPIGLGPYRVTRWDRGSRILLDADPHYFRGSPSISRIELQAIANPNTALTDFRAGGLDVFTVTGLSGSGSTYATAKAVPHTRAMLVDKVDFDYLVIDVAHPPLDELAVRRALVRGIDADGLMTRLAGVLHAPGSGDRARGTFAYDPSIRQPAYDPAQANALLDAAGWKRRGAFRYRDGVKLALTIAAPSGYPFFEQFGVQTQSALRALGIDAALHLYPEAQLEAPVADGGILASGKFDLTLSYWSPGNVNDHSYLYRCDVRPPNGQNLSRICDPAIDRDAGIELTAIDPAAEAAADRRILRRLEDQADIMFFGFERAAFVVPDDLREFRPTPLGRTFWNAYAWTRGGMK